MKRTIITPSAKRAIWITICVTLAVILVTLITGAAYIQSLLNLINKNPDNSAMSQEEYEQFLKDQAAMGSDSTGETIDPDDVDLNLHNRPVSNQKHITNIMLIGQDRRPGENRTRSDVMILCTINSKTKELTLTSFMRDMYVAIPGYENDKMNASYYLGGMKLLDQCMKDNFGVHVDGNIEVDFDGFADIVDLMGGLEISLTEGEANFLRMFEFDVRPGRNKLNGKAVVLYTRIRTVGNSDYTRTERQRKVLNLLFEKCRGMSLTKLKALVEKTLPLITTDMTNRKILDYVTDFLPMLGDVEVYSGRIPADGTFKEVSIRGMDVLLPDLEANRAILNEIMTRTVRQNKD